MTNTKSTADEESVARRVLLIEDDAWLGELQVSLLERAGYEVQHATNALEAVDLVEGFMPEIIIADVLLAGSTIFTLLHELQSYDDTANIPVILCTNMAEQLRNVELKDYGVSRVIDKATMAPDDIVVAIKAVFALQAGVS